MEETEDKMASLTINVDATRKLLELRNLDVDQIRREGRCCEVLRSIRDDAEQFANRLRNAPNAEAHGRRNRTVQPLVGDSGGDA